MEHRTICRRVWHYTADPGLYAVLVSVGCLALEHRQSLLRCYIGQLWQRLNSEDLIKGMSSLVSHVGRDYLLAIFTETASFLEAEVGLLSSLAALDIAPSPRTSPCFVNACNSKTIIYLILSIWRTP